MRASKEYRKWINRVRSSVGKRNGVICSFCLDAPRMDVKDDNSKRNYNRSDLKYIRGRNRKRP